MRISSKVLTKLFRECINDRCPQIAASLAYTTLLALIPISILIYKIFSTAFVNSEWLLKVQTFVFESLSPTTSEQVRKYLFESALNSSGINIFGILMLIISAVIMMYTIDSALNSIWKINKPRYLLRRVLVYLLILVFGPLAISFSLFVSTYLASLPVLELLFGKTIDDTMLQWLPFIVIWLAFTMLYKWAPDCEVKWLNAFSGATIAAILFSLAKGIFALYVSYVPTYQILYGALASIPLLLIWLYLTWLTVLFGAEITHFMEKQFYTEESG